LAALAVFLAPPAAAVRPPEACAAIEARGVSYVVCRFDPATEDIRLFLNGSDGEPYRHFSRLEAALARDGVKLRFAMNAGMYRPNRAPVGLYVEEGATRAAVNRRDCSGNFCLKPNGVFWIGEDGAAHVTETAAFIAAAPAARYATQSGPMLVVGGDIHPKFLKDSPSRHRRNGVGVTASGAVVFAISDAPVTFHAFASLFRDELRTPDALYLDGAISRLYASELGRHDDGAAMGPIVAVVASSQ
jgi:uncharacterized protein YigE (DUF2233 family)